MTQKERLIELLKAVPITTEEIVNDQGEYWGAIVSNSIIADYLLDNGVIVPPCKVGDTVYEIAHDCSDPSDGYCDNVCYSCKYHCLTICEVLVDNLHKLITVMNYWGKKYFPTCEEAEQALKERDKE